MQKVSYMGNGETTEFTFSFPYFENSNIIVTKNGATATGYSIVGTSAGLDADIPYTGGKVVFETAPTALDSITIARSLPLTRTVDYQPLAKLEPTTLNQDANYLMEVIKDLNDELETLTTQYSDIANKESTAVLLAKMAEIHNEIVAVSAQITALGDISTLRSSVATNTGDITTLKGYDYVVEFQAPTADNNYTWYRKYKSGWVEQGGIDQSQAQSSCDIIYPIQMAGTNYTLIAFAKSPHATSESTVHGCHYTNKTTTTCSIISLSLDGNWLAAEINWYVCGYCA